MTHELLFTERGTRVSAKCTCGEKIICFTYGNGAGYSYGICDTHKQFVDHLKDVGILQLTPVNPAWAARAVSVRMNGKYIGTAGETKGNRWGWMRGGHFRRGSRYATIESVVFSLVHYIRTGESLHY